MGGEDHASIKIKVLFKIIICLYIYIKELYFNVPRYIYIHYRMFTPSKNNRQIPKQMLYLHDSKKRNRILEVLDGGVHSGF